MLSHLGKTIAVIFLSILFTVSSGWILPRPAFASIHLDPSLPIHIYKILANKKLISEAKSFLNTTPEMVCTAYFDKLNGVNISTWKTLERGVAATLTVTNAISSASAAGAGALAGYAGISSAVSQLGLGWLTTAIAGMMGSQVTGAAATAVVTSAVGGPVVMGTLLVGGAGAVTFGTYEVGKFTVKKLDKWAESYCLSR